MKHRGPGSMNRAFRLVWNEAAGAYVAVAELSRSRGKGRAGGASALAGVVLAGASLAALAQATPPPVTALPTGGTVTQGQAQLAQNGARLDISQGSDKAVINWQSFNIGAQAQVNFQQPGASSVALNRVVGADMSQIFGRLSSNGRVVLVNPNGIVFGQGAQVDVGGLVASTLSLADEDFMAGRMRFTRGAAAGSVSNQGRLTAAEGGHVALLAPEVRNEGVVSARLGTVALAGGDVVTLNFDGARLLGVKVEPSTLGTLIENRQALVAEGGQVILAAGAARQLMQQAVAGSSGASQLLEQDGVLRLVANTGSISAQGGQVTVSAGNVELSGEIAARDGGRIQLQADYVGQSGRLDVSSAQGAGGTVQVQAETVVQTAQAVVAADGGTRGGRIAVTGSTGSTGAEAGSVLYSSARLSALGGSGRGGDIDLSAASLQLRAATLDASGADGGRLRIGGGFHGADADLGNATTVGINASTVLRADAAGARGDGGQVVVWSDAKTLFAAGLSARGGSQAGAGGQAEVSGKQELVFQGLADLSSRDGRPGQLLLDPRNILVDNASAALATLAMSDPTPGSNNGFGSTVSVLGNGNVVVTAPRANTGGTTSTGAAYLFNSQTGALLANLRGTNAGDRVGSGGIKVLGNGNYLVLSPDYGTISNRTVTSYDSQDSDGTGASPAASRAYALLDNTTASAGAITWQSLAGSGSHTVGSGNSLVGSTANVDSLTRYTYSGLTVNNAGAVTVTANDRVGGTDMLDAGGNNVVRPGTTFTELTDGNLAIGVPTWFNGRGAVVWMNASNGQLAGGASGGAISASTALVGSTPNRTEALVSAAASDSSKKVYVLGQRTAQNPLYTPVDLERFASASLPYQYSDGGTNRRTTTPGAAGDMVGQLITPLPGGSYVINSPLWSNGGTAYVGAVTWGASGGAVGTIGTGNSLVGSSAYDFVGSSGIKTVGSSGQNYVVVSPYWSGNGNAAAGRFLENNPNGAVTWVDGSNGQPFGAGSAGAAVSASNSRIGGAGDGIGSYSLGDTLPYSSYDYNGSTLITTSTTRKVGAISGGVRVLSNGNYLIDATSWSSGAGAVGFGDGALGAAGVASSSNSLVGSTAADQVGQFIVELAGGNYAVVSPNWDNGASVNAGAVTWGNGTTGRTGAVGSGNSLVGSDAYEAVGSGGVQAVGATGGNGLRTNYIVLSPQWGNRSSSAQSTVAYGAVTWVDGSNGQPFGAGSTGAAVSASNSLVGNHAGDYVGSVHYGDTRSGNYNSSGNGVYYTSVGNWDALLTASVSVLSDGNYVVRSPGWDSGKGAATLGTGGTGLAGTISASNSLVGAVSDVTSVSTTNQTRGGVSWTDVTTYLTTTGDHVGLLGGALNGGSYLVVSPFWGSGKGAITWLGSGNSTGTVSSSNSLVGNTADTFNNANHTAITAVGDRLGTLATTAWVTPTVSSGTVSGSAASTTTIRPVGPYVGTATTATYGSNYSVPQPQSLSVQPDGYGGVYTGFLLNVTPIYQQLSNGNVLVASPNWNNTGAAQAGAVTWINGSNGQLAGGASGGVLSASNSLVGSHAGDYIGFRLPIDGVTELTNGNFVLSNSQWWSERGAVTWGSGTAGVTGTISASNSLVGSTGSASVQQTTANQKLLGMTDYADYINRYIEGKGFNYDWPDRVTTMDGDRVGYGGVKALADGNAVVASPFWGSIAAWDQYSAPASKGAASWINGSNGQLKDGSAGGAVSAANSLVGAVAGDAVSYSAFIDPNSTLHFAYGGITTLAGGRYAVASPWWSNGTATGAGAVTFGDTGGVAGTVSASNSLVGSSAGDHIGMATSLYDSYLGVSSVVSGVVAVTANGQTNYVVRSANWTNTADRSGGGAGAGAITWVNGTTGRAYGESSTGATVSASNSLVGNAAGDGVGANFVTLTRNGTATGDLLFMSALDYCGIDGYGAVTLLSGAQGAAGQVGWRNSILGLAQSGLGQNTSTASAGTLTSDIQVALLPTAVTSAERVAYRPLIWAAPNGTSGKNSSQLFAATLVDESASGGSIVTPVHNAGGANWNGNRFVPDGSGYTASGGSTSSGLLGFSANPSTDIVITPSAITGMLNAGTSVTLQANNDIRVARAIGASAGGAGGNLTLEAGRSVYVDANITTDNGNLSVIANQGAAQGVVDANCSSCVSEIVQRAGTTLDAGTGQLAITLKKSVDKTSNAAGDIVLDDLRGASITVTNAGLNASSQGRGVRFQSGAVIGSSGTSSLVFHVGGYTAQGGGLLLAGDTQLVGANGGTLQVAAADPTLTAALGATNAGFGILSSQIGAVIQQSTGFTDLKFGRADQTGVTAVAAMDFTQASMKRGGATLDADVSLLGGSGGTTLLGALTSGAATDRRLTLKADGGTLSLGSATLTASTGVLELSSGTAGTVTQGGSGTLNVNQLLLTGTGTTTLTGSGNAVGTVAGQLGSGTLKNAASTLTVGTVDGIDGLAFTTGGTLQAAGASSDVVLNKALSTGSGDLVVAAGRNFVNNLATDTGLSVGSGRYLVYSTSPSGTTEGMSSYNKKYNLTYSSVPGSGNWFVYSIAPTLTVSVGAGSSITYGDSGSAPGVNITGFIDGDTQGSATTGSLNFTSSGYVPSSAGYQPVGTYTVNLTGQGSFASSLGYQITVNTGSSSFTVNPKAINVGGLTAANKVYDGTTSAQVSGVAAISGGGATSNDGKALNGDDVYITGSASGAFADRHAGTGKSVTLGGLTLGGSDAANYTISAGSVLADITPKALTTSGLSVAASRAYNGVVAATPLGTAALLAAETAGSGSTADGKPYSLDTVSISGTATATYNSSQVAQASQVQFGGLTLSGANAGNYTLPLGTQAATITPKALTVTGTAVSNKVYDGLTTASLSGGSLVGVVGGDNVTLTQLGSFADKSAGTAKPVTAADTLGGTDAGNYSLTQPTGLTADITPKALTVTGTTVANKVYDGLTTASLGGGSLVGVIGGDTVTLTQLGSFADKNVGTAKAVTAADTLGGNDAGNYALTQPTGLTADITPKALTVTGTTVASKVYDGLAAASLSGGSLVGVVGGDTVTLTQLGSFADRNVGTAKVVTAADTLGGSGAGNYTLTQPTGLTADITPKALTVTGTAVASKVYDGLQLASLSGGSLVGVVGSDTVTLTQAGSFVDKNVGTAKAVAAADTLGGTDAGNYALTQPTGLAADITPKAVTVTGTVVANKVYDGLTTASLSGGSLVGVVGGDTVTLTQLGSFADKNVGTAKAVTAADTLGGTDAGNYSLTQPAGLTADITPKALSVTGTAVANKVYDGLTTVSLSGGSLVGVVGGDTVTLTQLGSFADRNAGTAKAVTAADTLGGADAGNYSLTQPTGLTADITPKALTVTGTTVASKVYDGLTAAALSGGSLVGVVGGDTVTLTQLGSFADKNVGTAKAVTAADTLGGADAGNYSLVQPTGLSTDITPKALTVSGTTVADKVYDGTLAAPLVGGSLVGLVMGDTVTLTELGSFASKNVGSGKAVTAASTLGGMDAGNYALVQPGGLSGNVTPKSVTVTGTRVADKTYDGSTAATLLGGSLVGLVGGDAVTLVEAGQFSDRNAGAAKAVTATNSLSGNDAGNYAIVQPTGLFASVGSRTVTVAGTVVGDKVYDGTTTAQLSGGSLVGVVGDDDVALAQTGQFVDKNVGTGKVVTASGTLTGAAAGNYAVSQPTDLRASITPRPLTVIADDQRKTYGDAEPALTYRLGGQGLATGDTAAGSLAGQLATASGAEASAGSHAITLGTLSVDANYRITSFVPATLTVDKAPLTLTLGSPTKVYGAADPTPGWSVDTTQLRYGEAAAAVVQLGSVSLPTGAQATAGTHAITGQASAANYEVSVRNGVLTVTPAPLTVRADDKAKTAGEQDPVLTWSLDPAQLRYQDSADVVQNVTLTAPTGAGTPPGSYAIQVTGATAQNYTLTLVDGVLTVKPSPAVKSENLQAQVTEPPRMTLVYTSVTQPIAAAPLPPAGSSGMGQAGSVTVLGGGVAGEAPTLAQLPALGAAVDGPAPAPLPSPGAATPVARLAVVLPLLQVQGSEMMQGIVTSRLFSPPAGSQVTYTARLANGSPLPAWLRFDGQTGRLEGTPPAGVGDVEVQITAQTADGQSATARLRVNNPRARR